MDTDYLTKMKKMYSVDWSVLGTMDWFLLLIGSLGSLLCVIALVYWIYSVFAYMVSVSLGKERMNNPSFWKKMAASLTILLLVMTGTLMLFLEQLYKYMDTWGIAV